MKCEFSGMFLDIDLVEVAGAVTSSSYPQPTETEARADVEKGAPFGLTQRAQVLPEFDDDAVLLEGKSRCELLCFCWDENTNSFFKGKGVSSE